MWELVRALREGGVTIILTTHYIDEAEEMADRIGVINKGEIILVEEKAELMRKLGKKQLTLQLQQPLDGAPGDARALRLELSPTTAASSIYTYDTKARARPASPRCCTTSRPPASASATCRPTQSSLEDIFVEPGEGRRNEPPRRSARDLPLRDGAHAPHAAAEHRLAGHLDLALFRRVRLGDRLAHQPRSTASATAPSSCPG